MRLFIVLLLILSGFSQAWALPPVEEPLAPAPLEDPLLTPTEAPLPPPPEEPPPPEPRKSDRPGFLQKMAEGFSLHRQNYLLPLTWGNVASSREDAELKFQISFKQRLWRGLYLAYTQKSFWRVLDQEDSRPFRETNYNPEVFYRWGRKAQWGLWGADAGVEHESNGAREPTSRSWNRLYLSPFLEFRKLRVDLKVWDRISEDAKETPDDPTGDENPDIVDYYGHGELRLAYQFPNDHMASAMGRWNFDTERGALQLDYSIPSPSRNIFFFAQLWTGYGETLIDYNRYVTRYGVGLIFKR